MVLTIDWHADTTRRTADTWGQSAGMAPSSYIVFTVCGRPREFRFSSNSRVTFQTRNEAHGSSYIGGGCRREQLKVCHCELLVIIRAYQFQIVLFSQIQDTKSGALEQWLPICEPWASCGELFCQFHKLAYLCSMSYFSSHCLVSSVTLPLWARHLSNECNLLCCCNE